MSTLVKDFMKQPVTSLALPNDVGTARDLMHRKSCHAIPLVEVSDSKEIQIRGMVTSDDLVGVYDDTIDIQQVMSTEVLSIAPQSSAQEAAKKMLDHELHHLLVMDNGRIVGMISSLDFVTLIAKNGI
ncbi:MAG: CBS domain-containing protein [Saprospiraceae bacterium]|nr:CBS domain-containing protein [Lewinella sp.]